jgi:hypothetical protein
VKPSSLNVSVKLPGTPPPGARGMTSLKTVVCDFPECVFSHFTAFASRLARTVFSSEKNFVEGVLEGDLEGVGMISRFL